MILRIKTETDFSLECFSKEGVRGWGAGVGSNSHQTAFLDSKSLKQPQVLKRLGENEESQSLAPELYGLQNTLSIFLLMENPGEEGLPSPSSKRGPWSPESLIIGSRTHSIDLYADLYPIQCSLLPNRESTSKESRQLKFSFLKPSLATTWPSSYTEEGTGMYPSRSIHSLTEIKQKLEMAESDT